MVEIPIAIESLRREYIRDININSNDTEYLNNLKKMFKHWAVNHIDMEKYEFESKEEYKEFNYKLEEEVNRVVASDYFYLSRLDRQ